MSFFFLLRDTRYEAVLLSWTITTISIALTMIKLPWNAVVASLMLSTVGTFIIFLESHRHNLAMYLLARQFEDTLLENERLAEETHAQELRHMIANVAHDLKTVRNCLRLHSVSYY